MVNIGILGTQDCGKTSVFVYFMNHLTNNGEKIISGAPGGPEKYATETVDLIRFTAKGFIHVLYGTGGHKRPITDYYRTFVLRNADKFLCMFDLSIPLDKQFEFYNDIEDIYPTVAIEYKNTAEYEQYNKNCIESLFSLCEFDKSSVFDVWEGQ
jgi:hypothetical protein